METVTKIDIIKSKIFCYDENSNTKEIYTLTSEYDFFMNEFSDTQDLLTVNIKYPVKRIVKFYEIKESVPQYYIQKLFIDMTETQKNKLNDMIELIKNK